MTSGNRAFVLGKGRAQRISVSENGVASVFEAGNGALGSLLVSSTAGVDDHNRNISEIGGMPDGGLYSNLHGNADDCKERDAAAMERDVQRSADESRHGYFVEHRFICKGCQFGHKLELQRVGWETGFYSGDVSDPLPCHSRPQLGEARNFVGECHMTSKEDTQTGFASCTQDLSHTCDDLLTFGDLANHANLHVINEKSCTLRIAELVQGLRYFQAKSTLHVRTTNLSEHERLGVFLRVV